MSVKTFLLKLDSEVYTRWKSYAVARKMSLSEWIRENCNNPSVEEQPSLEQQAKNVAEFDAHTEFIKRNGGVLRVSKPERLKPSVKTCPHGKEKGWNCGLCGGMAKVSE